MPTNPSVSAGAKVRAFSFLLCSRVPPRPGTINTRVDLFFPPGLVQNRKLIHLFAHSFIYIYNYLGSYVPMEVPPMPGHSAHVEVRGWLSGVGSLLPRGRASG